MTKEKYALLDTDFISKTHLIRKDDQNKMILDDGGPALLHYLKKVVMYIRYLWLRAYVREKQSADYDKAHNRKMNMWADY